jgi:hypothetical protein
VEQAKHAGNNQNGRSPKLQMNGFANLSHLTLHFKAPEQRL